MCIVQVGLSFIVILDHGTLSTHNLILPMKPTSFNYEDLISKK